MDSTLSLRRYAPAVALVGTVGLLRAVVARPHDPAALADAEARLLHHVQAPLTHRFVQAGRHPIHTAIVGDGPPLVMLHGHGGGVGVWYSNLAALARHFRVYALDWLGWGRSARPPFTGTSAEAARNWWLNSLEDWRRAMGLSDFFLLGHSLGGWLAAEYALAYGQHVRHLILENAAGLLDGDVLPHKSLFYLISPQRLVQVAGLLGPRLVAYGCADEVARCPYDRAALLDYYHGLSVAPLSGQLAFERLLTLRHWRLPLVPRAERLTMPTTILWGLNDELLRIRHAHHFMAHLPRARLVTFSHAFHSPHGEEAERFNEVVISCRYQPEGPLAPVS